MAMNLSPVKNMMNMVRSAQNPQAMINNLAQKNPQMQSAIQYVDANGGDPKAAFYNLAKEKGVDPDTILAQLR